MYGEKLRELLARLPGSGTLDDPTHVGEAENPVCGDVARLYLKVTDGKVVDIRFQARGCPAALAASAAVVELCRNKTVEDCLKLDRQVLVDYLGGLPTHKFHGPDVALEALKKALKGK